MDDLLAIRDCIFGKTKHTLDIFDKNYKLIIIYDVYEEIHDGYCSDPGNNHIYHVRETYEFPLLKNMELLYDDNNKLFHEMLDRYYSIKPDAGHPHDACQCMKEYSIKDVRIVSLDKYKHLKTYFFKTYPLKTEKVRTEINCTNIHDYKSKYNYT